MERDAQMTANELRSQIVVLLPRLRRYAFALAGSYHDGDDLLQATVERLLVKPIPVDAALDRWSFRVCRNIWIDEIRARKVRNAVSYDEQPMCEETHDGERKIMGDLALKEVAEAMKQLSDDQRMPLVLVALEGLSYAEAAEILEVPIGTIMSRISRARSVLASLLNRNFPQGNSRQSAGVKS